MWGIYGSHFMALCIPDLHSGLQHVTLGIWFQCQRVNTVVIDLYLCWMCHFLVSTTVIAKGTAVLILKLGFGHKSELAQSGSYLHIMFPCDSF
jgi:hypothetical protein